MSNLNPNLKLSRKQVIHIASQLAIMIDAGVTLSEALDCISQQSDDPMIHDMVSDLAEQIQSGASFSEALSHHPRSFSPLFICLIRASEKTGMLSKLLIRATQYLKEEEETRRKVRGAITYPGIMAAFAVATTSFLLAFVLPKFTAIYANKRAALPVPTKILMACSDALVHHWIAILATIITLVTGFIFAKRTETGKIFWHQCQLKMPFFGKMYARVHLAHGLRMIGAMASAGVTLLDCINIAIDLCENTNFKNMWDNVRTQIQAGKPMSDPLFQTSLVPRSVAQMIASGEKTGKLSSVMEQIAIHSEDELKEQIAQLTRYIEPAMIAIMGLIVGGVSMAMLLPIFSLSKVLAH